MTAAQALAAARWWGALLLLVVLLRVVSWPWRAQLDAWWERVSLRMFGPDGAYADDDG